MNEQLPRANLFAELERLAADSDSSSGTLDVFQVLTRAESQDDFHVGLDYALGTRPDSHAHGVVGRQQQSAQSSERNRTEFHRRLGNGLDSTRPFSVRGRQTRRRKSRILSVAAPRNERAIPTVSRRIRLRAS